MFTPPSEYQYEDIRLEDLTDLAATKACQRWLKSTLNQFFVDLSEANLEEPIDWFAVQEIKGDIARINLLLIEVQTIREQQTNKAKKEYRANRRANDEARQKRDIEARAERQRLHEAHQAAAQEAAAVRREEARKKGETFSRMFVDVAKERFPDVFEAVKQEIYITHPELLQRT